MTQPEVGPDTVESERIGPMSGMPSRYDEIAAHPRWESAQLSSVTMLLCGEVPVPTDAICRRPDRGLASVRARA